MARQDKRRTPMAGDAAAKKRAKAGGSPQTPAEDTEELLVALGEASGGADEGDAQAADDDNDAGATASAPANGKKTNRKPPGSSKKATSKKAASKKATGPASAAKKKSAANGKAAAAAPKRKPAAATKRKVRTAEDKLAENASMAQPFFVETGAEWNATDIDFEELATLRGMWELPAACHLLWLMQTPLTLRFSNTLLEYEAALLKPEDSPVLEDVFTKLLLKKSERDCLSAGIGLKYEWWNKQLRDYYMALYDKWYALLRKAGEKLPDTFSHDEDDTTASSSSDLDEDDENGENRARKREVDVELSDDEWLALDILKARLDGLGAVCPLKHKSFADLSADLRCRILLNLCEAVVEDPVNTEYIRMMEEDDLRVEPLGNDRAGNLFYFFPQFYEERRIYRLNVQTHEWALWAKDDEAFHSMLAGMKALRGRKVRGEQELLDHLEVIIEQIEEESVVRAKQVEKANRLAILEAIPRKRSLRLQVKQLEEMEKMREEKEEVQQLTAQQIADLKRAELLQKVEREAEREARQQEREAKRLEREQHEKEAAMVERELRRQRRREQELEQERLAEENGRKLEEDRKKREEARLLRALQRQATEREVEEEEEEEKEKEDDDEDEEAGGETNTDEHMKVAAAPEVDEPAE